MPGHMPERDPGKPFPRSPSSPLSCQPSPQRLEPRGLIGTGGFSKLNEAKTGE